MDPLFPYTTIFRTEPHRVERDGLDADAEARHRRARRHRAGERNHARRRQESAPRQHHCVTATTATDLAGRSNTSLPPRSEEHTSELQPLMRTSYAVICLKKKKLNDTIHKLTE